jgi:hypothetical protein
MGKIMHGEAPDVDLAGFSPQRFAAARIRIG